MADEVLVRQCQLLIPSAATDDQILTCHTREYLEKIKSGELTDLEIRRIGFPWSKKMVERSRRSTGASIAAGRAALEDGFSVNLAGGTHHSFADSGQGYCVFNDVCVAARVLKAQSRIQNALVLDCDVHQGNGTAGIANGDESIFACSLHCDKNYPFRKTVGDLDVALPVGCDDELYLYELNKALNRIWEEFEPDIVFYLAGADPFAGDRLGMMELTKEGLRKRDELVFEFCKQRSKPVSIAMAGGYAPETRDIVDIHFSTVRSAFQFCLNSV